MWEIPARKECKENVKIFAFCSMAAKTRRKPFVFNDLRALTPGPGRGTLIEAINVFNDLAVITIPGQPENNHSTIGKHEEDNQNSDYPV